MKKSILALFLIFALLTTLLCPAVSAYQLAGFEVRAQSVILASLDTGDILYSKQADKRVYPAAITKIMVVLLMLERTKNLDTEMITITQSAIDSLEGTDSAINLKADEQLSARQAIYYLMMASSNECANAVALHYGNGSISSFIDMMNARAEELGMNGTHYANAHGLHDDEHYTTAADVYTLMGEALGHELFRQAIGATRYSLAATNKQPARTLVTTDYLHDMNNALGYDYFYRYATGGKTGFTDEAGRCLVTTASKNGYNYICVLMNSPVTDASGQNVRYEFADSKALYNWAFDNFEYKTLVDTATPVAEAQVELCWDRDHVSLVLEGGLSAILPKDADSSTVQIKPHLEKETFKAPIKKGEVLGTADIVYAGEVLGTVNLLASDTLDVNYVLVVIDWLKTALKSTAFKIILIAAVLAVIIFTAAVIVMNRNRKKRRHSRRGYKGYSKH